MRECAVVGIPDIKWGEVIKAFIVPTDPAVPPDFADLRAWARSQLASFKVPTEWAVVNELPKNPAGKLLRRVLATAEQLN